MSVHEQPRARSEAQPQGLRAMAEGLTARALLLALGLTVLNYVTGVTYVVPPVPALLSLLVLQALNVVLTRVHSVRPLPGPLRPLSHGELLVIYMAVAAALSMSFGAAVLHYLIFGQYYGGNVEDWQRFFALYPSWYVPHDAEVIKGYFQSTPSGQVPWQAWRTPVLWWSGFNLALVVMLLCLVGLFRRQWGEAERLNYPMLFLPLEITGASPGGARTRGFFGNRIMWIGAGVAAVYNGVNILHAFHPAFPGITHWRPLFSGTEGPLSYFEPLHWTWTLEIVGLGFLISGEVLFSSWFFFLFMKLVKMVGMLAGYREAGFPFLREISSGACIAYVAWMIYVARPHLRRVFERVVRGPGDYDRNEAMPYQFMVFGLAGSVGVLLWMLGHAGMRTGPAAAYFVSLVIFVLAAAKLRAEAGPPVLWTHPWGYATRMPLDLLGARWFRGGGPITSLTIYHSLEYIGRMVFAPSTAQSFTDGLKLAEYGPVRRSAMAQAMLAVCVIGILLAFWQTLGVNYRDGHELVIAKQGGFSVANDFSRVQYLMLSAEAAEPSGPDWTRVGFYAAGLVMGLGVAWGRMAIPGFPLHPAGLILATLDGEGGSRWAPFLMAWVAQRIALRYGGQGAYRRAIPGFLGMALSHILIGPVIWKKLAARFFDRSLIMRYHVGIG